MSKFINERAPEPTVTGVELKAKRRYVEPEVPQAGARVVDVSNRIFVPPPGNIQVVRGKFNERLWQKAKRIQNPW